MKFNTFEIQESILKAIEEKGYEEATPIQEQAIPPALLGNDILGCAQTGTGKTAAFLIPSIQRLQEHHPKHIRTLVLTPTRELAIQISENLDVYSKYTNLKSCVIFGGVAQKPQQQAIEKGVDILIATPGRLLDLVKQKIISLAHIEIFILDEADRMLDMGFLFDMKRVIALLPKKKQTMFFSATMSKEIKTLAQSLLHKPVLIEVTPPSTTVESIEQTLYYVDKPNKKYLLLDLLKKEKMKSVLVFTRTKHNANRLAKFLEEAHQSVGVIHGNKSQNARQIALTKFKNGEVRILVATDIAARGIDVSELQFVINYDIPQDIEAYVHRIGRTGRAGHDGISISFCDIDEMGLVKDIEKLIRMKIDVNRDHKYPMRNLQPTEKKTQRGSSRTNSTKRNKDNEHSSTSSKSKDTKKNKDKEQTKDCKDQRKRTSKEGTKRKANDVDTNKEKPVYKKKKKVNDEKRARRSSYKKEGATSSKQGNKRTTSSRPYANKTKNANKQRVQSNRGGSL